MRETLWFDAWHANAMIYQSSSNSSKIPSLKSLYSMFVIRAPQIPTMLGLLESERDIKNAKKARFSSCKKKESSSNGGCFKTFHDFHAKMSWHLPTQLSVLLAALCFVLFSHNSPALFDGCDEIRFLAWNHFNITRTQHLIDRDDGFTWWCRWGMWLVECVVCSQHLTIERYKSTK